MNNEEIEEPSIGNVAEVARPKPNFPSLTQNPSLLPYLADTLIDVARDLEKIRHPEDDDPSDEDRAVLSACIKVGRACGVKPVVDIQLNWSAFEYLFTGNRVTSSTCGRHYRRTEDRGNAVLVYTAVKSVKREYDMEADKEITL